MKVAHLFSWPLALIALGVIWLLISVGWIPVNNLWAMYAPQVGWDRAPKIERVIKNIQAGAIPGSGKILTETRLPDEFDAITINYPGSIFIRQSDKNCVTVQTEDNLLPQLATRVEDGVLVIENKEDQYFKRVAPTQTVVITISVKDLKQIVIVGEVRFEVNGLKTDNLLLTQRGNVDAILTGLDLESLSVNMSQGGRVTSTGQADQLFLSIAKKGEFDGSELRTRVTKIDISGIVTATTWVEDELHASLIGTATVNYYGSPELIQQSINGTGSINKLGEWK